MNRFRVYDNRTKRILERPIIVFQDNVISVSSNENSVIDDYVLMQYTGLHDKNGKEIYEGDVIRILHPWKNRTHVGEVFKDNYMFNIKGFFFTHFDFPNQAFSEGTGFMEVIGNIHEHPHLVNT